MWLGDSTTQNKFSINYINNETVLSMWGGMEERAESGTVRSFTHTDSSSTTCNLRIHMDERNKYSGVMNVFLPSGENISHPFTLQRGNGNNCSIL